MKLFFSDSARTMLWFVLKLTDTIVGFGKSTRPKDITNFPKQLKKSRRESLKMFR